MKFILTFFFTSIFSSVFAINYFVSNIYGDDDNNGTCLVSPFKTIEKAATIMQAGDVCYIRKGSYHETINVENINGSDDMPILFTNYNNERVVMDGTKSIDSIWILFSENIWRTTINFDIWQFCLLTDQK